MMLPTHPARTTLRLGGIASALLALCLSGCSSDNAVDWEQAYQALQTALSSDSQGITLQQAAAIPYASMGIRIGGGPEQIVVLAGNEQNTLLWTSAARIALETQDGRIVRTGGFSFNLGTTTFRSQDPLATKAYAKGTADSSRIVDLPDQHVYSAVLNCQMSAAGDETIKILGQDIPTTKVMEACRNDQLDWSFTNVFWVGQSSGLVWRSRQFIHPKLPAIETEVLRPPG